MGIENKINDILQDYPMVKIVFKRCYQRFMFVMSHKVKYEGDVTRISPDDGYEYFFGYYDKSPWDADDRYMIALKVKQAYRCVAPNEEGELVLIDTQNGNKITAFAKTHAWNVQQGCMAQWLGPDFSTCIIYNDFRNGSYCSVVYNVKKRKEERVYDIPVYDVAKDGKFALSLDFSRLHRLRPGYGYSNLPDKTVKNLCPDQCAIWKLDLITGEVFELFKYTELAAFESRPEMKDAEHKVNHLMISPDGKRFMMLYRWYVGKKKYTRLLTASCNGTELYNLSDDDFASHCYWKNNNEILSFLSKKESGKHYYLMQDRTQNYRMLWPELENDGHPSYSPDGSMVVTDTYPNRVRMASLYICRGEGVKQIARVFAPFRYDNDVRCDLHPRWNHTGDKICIDSVLNGKRGLYCVPVKKKTFSRPAVCIRKCVNKGPVHQTFNILNNINDTEINPIFITLKKEDKKDTSFSKFNNLNITKLCLSETKLELLKAIVLGRGKMIDELRKVDPTVIHTTGIIVDLFGYRVAKTLNIKQISTIRNYVYDDYLNKFGKIKGTLVARIHLYMMRRLTENCIFVCCSKSLADKYWINEKIKMDYIRNGVDSNRFCSEIVPDKYTCRKELGLFTESFIFITVAQIIARKNISETIEALPERVIGKKALFVLVGDGVELNNLRETYANRSNVIFVGKQSNIEKWLKASDVFVSSSESEGLPNSVIEAMAMGLPVILSDIPQHKELFELNPEIGCLYELYNINDLKEKFSFLTEEKMQIWGENGKKLANGELSAKRMSNEYQELYRSIPVIQK
jgi:glycosyltransferase involved in cell wall biosynthesis